MIDANLNGVNKPVTDSIHATVTELTEELHELQLAIHANPQIAFQETFAHDISCDYMEKKGWKVTRHAYGLETAWEAVMEVGTGGPVIGYNSEMDSLPNLGHACGHNLICMGGIAAAIATARALETHGIPGRVVCLGTPAEEVYGGKCYLLQRGAYKDWEGCLMLHAYVRGSGCRIHLTPCIAAFSVQYTGISAHAGDKPEDGVNALDAAVSAYNSIAMLRQHLPSDHKITIVIKGSEKFISNTVPNQSSIWVGVRAPSGRQTVKAIDKVLNCLKAGALSSGCTYKISREHMYMDMQQSEAFTEYFTQVTEGRWGKEAYPVDRTPITAGTDLGNVSYHMPALHALFYLPEAKAGDFPHSETFAQWTNTKSATLTTLKTAEAIATVGIRMIIDRPWAAEVKKDWVDNMIRLDGHNVRRQVEEVFESYPLNPDVDRMVCACH